MVCIDRQNGYCTKYPICIEDTRTRQKCYFKGPTNNWIFIDDKYYYDENEWDLMVCSPGQDHCNCPKRDDYNNTIAKQYVNCNGPCLDDVGCQDIAQ